MGNYGSRILNPSKSTTAKLFDTRGNLRRVDVPVKAAEMMLEEPGHIVSPVDELRRTGRISALRADEELQAGKLYVLFPADRVYCRVSQVEKALIDSTCQKRRVGLKRNKPKVFPAMVTETDGEGEKGEGIVKPLEKTTDTGFSGHRLGNYRPWTPVLDPIREGN